MKVAFLSLLTMFLLTTISMDSPEPSVDIMDVACNRGEVERGNSCIPMSEATDEEVKKYLISRSIATYSCPYNRDRAGRRCGKRSAYSKPDGASPFCYTSDITSRQVQRTRQQFE